MGRIDIWGTVFACICENIVWLLLFTENVVMKVHVFWQGKAPLTTYWLHGKEGFDMPLPDLSKAAGIEEHEFK